MPDTIRSQAAILALLADNTSGDISPQDLRDAIVSLYAETPASMTVSAFDTETTNGTLNPSFRRIVYLTDGPYTCIWNGSAWEYYHGGIKCTRPDDSGFAWVNQGSATISSSGGCPVITAPSRVGDNSQHLRVKSAPSTPYTITAVIDPSELAVRNYNAIGIVVRESSSGKYLSINFGVATGSWDVNCTRMTNATSFSAHSASATLLYKPKLVLFKIEHNGTNIITSWKFIGSAGWKQLNSQSATSFMAGGPDQYGWMLDGNSGAEVRAALLSLTVG